MYKNCQELRSNPETCNAGKKWETEEDELLVKLVNENKSHQEIAIEFKRTEGSIRARIIDKIIFPKYNNENITELAKKYNFNDIEYLERCIKVRIEKENAIIAENIISNETKEEYEERMEKIKKEKLNKKIERNQIKAMGGEKYYELLLNIVERLERIEKKIDGYDFT